MYLRKRGVCGEAVGEAGGVGVGPPVHGTVRVDSQLLSNWKVRTNSGVKTRMDGLFFSFFLEVVWSLDNRRTDGLSWNVLLTQTPLFHAVQVSRNVTGHSQFHGVLALPPPAAPRPLCFTSTIPSMCNLVTFRCLEICGLRNKSISAPGAILISRGTQAR